MENVWLKNEKFEEIHTAFKQWNDTADQQVMKKQRKLFVKSLLETFFHRGTEGLELANYFADTPNPYTGKKIRAIRSKFNSTKNYKIIMGHYSETLPNSKLEFTDSCERKCPSKKLHVVGRK